MLREWKEMALGTDSHLFDSCSPGCRHNQTRAFTPHLERATPFYKVIDPRISRHKQTQFVPHHGPTNSWKLTTNEDKVIHEPPNIYAPCHFLGNLQTAESSSQPWTKGFVHHFSISTTHYRLTRSWKLTTYRKRQHHTKNHHCTLPPTT